MASYNHSDLRGAPSVLETASAPPLARVLDFLAGPLALAAAGITFFAAYDLTVTQPPDLFTGVQPAVVHSASARGAAPLQLGNGQAVNGQSRVSAPENVKIVSMPSGHASLR